jgi:6-phosphogluconolactonase
MKNPVFHDGGDIVSNAAAAVISMLRQALDARGQATLMVSGGRSPKPLYEKLSQAELDWSKVTISLVDERWVDPGEDGSNEDFIRQNLIKNKAKAATFFGLKTNHKTPAAGLNEAESRFAKSNRPFDICIMGMGSDAHTASWFPNSVGLKTAVAANNRRILCAITAKKSSVTGEHLKRISMTLNAVLESHAIVLFIPGEQKRRVFDALSNESVMAAPVKSLLGAGSNLHIFASPAS